MMGRKGRKSVVSTILVVILRFSFVAANVLMLIMVVVRCISIAIPSDVVNKVEFPYTCDEYTANGCARMVLQ